MTTATRPTGTKSALSQRDGTEAPIVVAKKLNKLLAETYGVRNATQMAHWNIEGPHFVALHGLFEEQYDDLAEAIDEIAERVRALGFYVSGTLQHFVELMDSPPAPVTGSEERLLSHLTRHHEIIVDTIRTYVPLAESAHDVATVDLLVRRIAWHEDAMWKLRSAFGKTSSPIS